MQVPERLIDSLDDIKIWIENNDDGEATLAISAAGKVESSNWANPELRYIESENPPPPGIHPFDVYEFEFFATPPQVGETYYMEPTDISAIFKWKGRSQFQNMKLIRVKTKAGHKELRVELGGPGTPLDADTDLES